MFALTGEDLAPIKNPMRPECHGLRRKPDFEFRSNVGLTCLSKLLVSSRQGCGKSKSSRKITPERPGIISAWRQP